MSKTIQIRDLDDDVYEALRQRGAEAGLTVPELLRREATRLAARLSVEEWLARTSRRPSGIERADVLAALDESRGAWPDAPLRAGGQSLEAEAARPSAIRLS
jgi:plasmid stability protein